MGKNLLADKLSSFEVKEVMVPGGKDQVMPVIQFNFKKYPDEAFRKLLYRAGIQYFRALKVWHVDSNGIKYPEYVQGGGFRMKYSDEALRDLRKVMPEKEKRVYQ